MKHSLTVLLFAFLYTSSFGQAKLGKYWIELIDKNDSPFNIHQPQEFLSAAALERRDVQGIPIVENDLPVSPNYIKIIKESGVAIHNISKWLNAVTVVATEEDVEKIAQLSFVKNTEYVGKHSAKKKTASNAEHRMAAINKAFEVSPNIYGQGAHQIKMLNGHLLHDIGYDGKDVLVAVQDGGFKNVDIMPFFDALRANGRLLPGKDFVDGDDNVYEISTHGSQVLSVMAANIPGVLIGSAPKASYICLRSEDTRSEYLVEECNWVAAAEYADSIGAHIINSSLGYTNFNDKEMSYAYEDLNGQTSRASKALDIAFSKGILVVNSAGNSGGSSWKYVGVPADAFNVISVGATNRDGKKARFSSFGPTADGRIKPEVSAIGQGIMVASNASYHVHPSSGTSFSSPLVAGAIASLKQAFPDEKIENIKAAIEQSADQYDHPDDNLGYGIPDFYKAYSSLMGDDLGKSPAMDIFHQNNTTSIVFLADFSDEATLVVEDFFGNSIFKQSFDKIAGQKAYRFSYSNEKKWPHFVHISTKNNIYTDRY